MCITLLLGLVLLSEGISQIWVHRTVRPCGPTLCGVLCHRYKGCSTKVFDEIQLTCQLIVKASTPDLSCNTTSVMGVFGDHPYKHLPEGKKMRNSERKCNFNAASCFMKACKEGNLLEVKRLICQGMVDVNSSLQLYRMTPVLYASSINKPNIFDFLVEQKGDLSARDIFLRGVLHHACISGAEDIVMKLVDIHGSDLERRCNYGHTPLVYAVREGHLSVVEFLRDRGADMKVVHSANTILHYACKGGHLPMVTYVLSLQIVDIDCRGMHSRTPLMFAVEFGHFPVVKRLLHYKANATLLDSYGSSILHYACRYSPVDVVKYLVTREELRGFERKKDKNGLTPVIIAEMKHRSNITAFFKSRTA